MQKTKPKKNPVKLRFVTCTYHFYNIAIALAEFDQKIIGDFIKD